MVDCGAKVVITSDGGYRRVAGSGLKLAADEARAKAASEGFEMEPVLYVMYTSGTTGKPEGILRRQQERTDGGERTQRIAFRGL